MKRLGRLVVMTGKEFDFMLCRSSDNDDATYRAGFNAGKFHAAGGYAHALYALRDRLTVAQGLAIRYKPIAEIFQPSKELTALLENVNGVSDCDAAADFEVVGNQARLAKVKS